MALSVEPQRSVRIGVGAARVQACLEWATTFLGILVGRKRQGRVSTLRELVVEDLASFCRILQTLSSCLPTPQTPVLGSEVI